MWESGPKFGLLTKIDQTLCIVWAIWSIEKCRKLFWTLRIIQMCPTVIVYLKLHWNSELLLFFPNFFSILIILIETFGHSSQDWIVTEHLGIVSIVSVAAEWDWVVFVLEVWVINLRFVIFTAKDLGWDKTGDRHCNNNQFLDNFLGKFSTLEHKGFKTVFKLNLV